MKPIFFITALCLCSGLLRAQGPSLVGMMYNGGLNNQATIIQYTGGATTVARVDSIISGVANCMTMVETSNGLMYGPTRTGGSLGFGSIVSYNYATNTYSVVASFDSSTTGKGPQGALLLASNDTIYGLTAYGGANGGGTLFCIAPGGNTIKKLVDLPSNANPLGALTQSADGYLYGLTHGDGTYSSGTIFKYSISPSVYTPLYSLASNAAPFIITLLEIGKDTLYGVTFDDGAQSKGTIFQYQVTSNVYTPLYSFTGTASSNGNPFGSLLLASNGQLYGTTSGYYTAQNGNLFSYNLSSNTYSDLHDFGSGADGITPNADLYQASDGMLYGTTRSGGRTGHGVIFQYDIVHSSYSLKVNLDSTTGETPIGGHFTEYIAPAVASVSIVQTVGTNPACADSSIAFTATPVNGGSSPSYQWKVGSTNVGTNSPTYTTTALTNGQVVSCVMTSNLGGVTGSPATSNPITVTVDSPAVPTISRIGVSNILSSTHALHYEWIVNNITSADTGQTFSMTGSGSYLVVTTDSQGCRASSAPDSFVYNGISNISEGPDVNIYPVPNQGSFVVEAEGVYDADLSIYDVYGQKLYGQKLTAGHTAFSDLGLPSAIYFLRISDQGRTKTIKMQIARD